MMYIHDRGTSNLQTIRFRIKILRGGVGGEGVYKSNLRQSEVL